MKAMLPAAAAAGNEARQDGEERGPATIHADERDRDAREHHGQRIRCEREREPGCRQQAAGHVVREEVFCAVDKHCP